MNWKYCPPDQPLAHAILNARPFAFLDDGAAEERRTRLVTTHRLMDLETAAAVGSISAEAIERLRAEVAPEPASADELHDALVVHGFLLSLHFSRILGMQLPGENTVIGTIDLKFHDPVYVGDTATFTATVTRILKPLGTVVLELLVTKQDGTKCVEGKTSCVFKAANDLQTARSRNL